MSHATTPPTIEAPGPPSPASGPPPTPAPNATLRSREDLNPGLAIFRVEPDAATLPFKAGQFAVLGLPLAPEGGGLVRRAYSIASPPQEHGPLEFYIQLVPNGTFTPLLWKCVPGDRLWIGPRAAGAFTIESIPATLDLLMLGTGTGIAPYVAMIRQQMADPTARRRIVIAHGARYARDLGYRLLLTGLAIECPDRLLYAPTISRPEPGDGWVGHVGRVESLIHDGTIERALGRAILPDRFHILLCGNPGMVDGLRQHFEAKGFREHTTRNPGNLHLEKYW